MRKAPVVHPLLFAIFPVLHVFSRNMRDFPFTVVFAPAGKALVMAGGFLLVAGILLRNFRKAGLLASLLAVLVASYGHAKEAFHRVDFSFGGEAYGPDTVLLPVYALVFAALAYRSVKAKGDLKNITSILNVTAICLVAFSVVNIGAYMLKHRDTREYEAMVERMRPGEGGAEAPGNSRNVYYIIVDGYSRADKLLELYGYDNSGMLEFLRSRGFYVAENARTNYSHTILSFTSSLNLTYLDELVAKIEDKSDDNEPLRRMIAWNKARGFLNQRGYRFVAFLTGYYTTNIKKADIFIAPAGWKDEFSSGVLGTTGVISARGRREKDQKRIHFAFEHLPDTADFGYPVFVFAHIIAPHPPFVFDGEGEDTGQDRYFRMASANHLICRDGITRKEYIERYVAQLEYTNKLLMGTIDSILERSRVEPIIVVQGDHGGGTFLNHEHLEGTYLGDRMSILNAYHLPEGGDGMLYDSITPVNTFRVIFNEYFGGEYPLLEDRSYFAIVPHNYTFVDVTEEIDGEADRGRLAVLRGMDYYPEELTREEEVTAESAAQ